MSLIVKKAKDLKPVDLTNQWLIEGLIPTRSLVLLSAAPKLGKSFLALDIMTSLSSGVKAFDQFNVNQTGGSLYIALEDSPSIVRDRLEAFSIAKEVSFESLNVNVVTDQILQLDQPDGRKALEASIKATQPKLVVIDNLARIHSGNENSAKAMGELFEFFQLLKRKYATTILVVCHAGKETKIRGSSQIDSYYEAGIFLKTSGNQTFMDLKFRGYPSVEGLPYRIVSEGKGTKVLVGAGIGVVAPKVKEERTRLVWISKNVVRNEAITDEEGEGNEET